jgi:hypothetical protein
MHGGAAMGNMWAESYNLEEKKSSRKFIIS